MLLSAVIITSTVDDTLDEHNMSVLLPSAAGSFLKRYLAVVSPYLSGDVEGLRQKAGSVATRPITGPRLPPHTHAVHRRARLQVCAVDSQPDSIVGVRADDAPKYGLLLDDVGLGCEALPSAAVPCITQGNNSSSFDGVTALANNGGARGASGFVLAVHACGTVCHWLCCVQHSCSA